MKISTINRLIELKETEIIELGAVYPNFEDDKLSVKQCILHGFEDVLMNFQSEILATALTVMIIFNDEIKEDILNGESYNTLKFQLRPSEDGFKLETQSYYLEKHMTEIRDEAFRANINKLVNSIETLTKNISTNINDEINKHIELSEIGKVREYTLLYDHGRNITRNDFVREIDRPIFEQKAEVQDLISRGITGDLYDSIIESNPELSDKRIAVKFTLIDNEHIEDIEFGTY